MAASKRTQKQIAERLKGNLDYYRRLHPLRGWRAAASALAIVGGLAAVPAYYYLRGPETFLSPGPISRAHAGFAQDCAACHNQTRRIAADTHQAGVILKQEYFVPLDQSCQSCHVSFAFHAPNVAPDATRPPGTGAQNENSSCTACHREHVTAGKMAPAGSESCASCHGRADLMAASSALGRDLPAKAFPNLARQTGGLRWFPKARPREGYTRVVTSFDQGHPPFAVLAGGFKDPDTLQYNHARHERADIPKTEKGQKLDCAYCHQGDATGMNFQAITFEANCAACHALKFDPDVPDLLIPHGDPEKVRSFLRTLGNQYLEYALREKRMTPAQAQAFAVSSVQNLAARYGGLANGVAGPRLEQQVFYSAEHVTSGAGALLRRSNAPGTGDKALFAGCAFCHQVSPPQPNVTPKITKAVIFDRWLADGNFNHAKHTQQTCAECHRSIPTSQLTADINLPTQQSCTKCHNSGPDGVANDCTSCHHYHNDPRLKTIKADHAETTAGETALRAMLLGQK